MIGTGTTVPAADAAVLLNVTPETLEFLARTEPFAPNSDQFTARQLFGIALLLHLGMLPLLDVIPAAISLAREADPTGSRVAAIVWPDRTPVLTWLTNGIDPDRPPRRPLFLIPCDTMFADVVSKIADYRARKARPN